MTTEKPKVTHVTADSVTIDGEVATTIVIALDDGRMFYTGATIGAEWNALPPIPPREEGE